MENSSNQNPNVGVETSVAMPRSVVPYGTASSLEVVGQSDATSVSLGFWEHLSYFYGEYAKGIFFVIASALFVLAVPAILTRPAKLWGMVIRVAKRTTDIVAAVVGLILTIPVWLIMPILIKLGSSGPVFYTQVRVGANQRRRSRRYCQRTDVPDRRSRERRRDDYNGRLFKLIKFRTMVADAERASGPIWATKNDPRVTRLGALMRKTRLDEIPQFLNILKGDMSLIGPRPERPNFVGELCGKIDDYSRRLEIRPGLTGLAQVETGYDSSLASVAEKVKYDIKYIDNWSYWLDVRIMLKTVMVVLTGKGAF